MPFLLGMSMEIKNRKPTRLKGYDYSQNGAYFITICSHDRRNLFSKVGAIHESPETVFVKLNKFGAILKYSISKTEKRFNINIPSYVIMPNHIHLIIEVNSSKYEQAIRESPLQNRRSILSNIIGYFKMNSSKEIHKINKDIQVWQRGYYDHVIRNEEDYINHIQYIDENPRKWLLGKDEYYQ